MGFQKKYANLFDVLQNTQRNGTCKEWQGALNKDGYACCNAYGLFKSQLLHREVFYLAKGFRPDVVMHACDNRRCINPNHLFEGSPEANLLDAWLKERHAVGSKNGRAKLTEKIVARMRKERHKNKQTYKDLSNKFGVSLSTVGRVLQNTNWKNHANI